MDFSKDGKNTLIQSMGALELLKGKVTRMIMGEIKLSSSPSPTSFIVLEMAEPFWLIERKRKSA